MATEGDQLSVLVYVAAPVDAPAPVRCTRELRNIAEALHDSGRAARLYSLWPSDPIRLRGKTGSVLHVSSHGGDGRLELQDRVGHSVDYTDEQFSAVLGSDWSLVILNGCDTQAVGEFINLHLGVSVVCTVGFLPDDAASTFPREFYSRLSAGDSIESAVYETNQALSTRWPAIEYLLLPGAVNRFPFVSGGTEVHQDFNATTRATSTSLLAMPSRRAFMIQAFEAIDGPDRCLRMTGPPGSGITSFLKAMEAYYGWCSPAGVRSFDGHSITKPQLGDFREALADDQGWVIVDHIEEADGSFVAELKTALSVDPQRRARILQGSAHPSKMGSLPSMELPPWNRGEALNWLKAELGDSSPWEWALDIVPLFPGKLNAFRALVRHGADQHEIVRILSSGDPLPRRAIVDEVWSAPRLRTLLTLVALYESPRRSLLKVAWGQILGLAEREELDGLFESSIGELNERGLIQIHPMIDKSGASVAYVETDADVRASVRAKRNGLTPNQQGAGIEAMALGLERLNEHEAMDADLDWSWVRHLMRMAESAGHWQTRILDAIYPHLDRGGEMRMIADVYKQRKIVDAAYELARNTGDWDKACQFALVQGEMRYRSGRLAESEREFRKIFRLRPSASRKVQAYRALGQVAYRRGQYHDALRAYERAAASVGSAESFVVTTIMQEEGKALSRLGRHAEAIGVLRNVVNRRQEDGGLRELSKAQHELARALLRVRQFPEAQQLFTLARDGAEATGAFKWALGPLYHLFLIDLETPDLETARRHHEELSTSATRMSEALWMTFADLGQAMLLFAEGRYEASHNVMADTIRAARSFGYAQVVEDAQEWVRRHTMDVVVSLGGFVQEDVAEVLALVENIPAGKARKALKYASGPAGIESVEVLMNSEHGARRIHWTSLQGWSCSCPMFEEFNRCSHLLAVSLQGFAPRNSTTMNGEQNVANRD